MKGFKEFAMGEIQELEKIGYAEKEGVLVGSLKDIVERIDNSLEAKEMTLLARLLFRKPLAPLTDEDDQWVEAYREGWDIIWKHRRYDQLWKSKIDDKVSYTDHRRCAVINLNDDGDETPHEIGFFTKMLDMICPIRFPYMPPLDPYIMYVGFIGDNFDDVQTYKAFWIKKIVSSSGYSVNENIIMRFDENRELEKITTNEYVRMALASENKEDQNG